MDKPLTVKELYEKCKEEIEKGHGDQVIMLSDDDEGNSFHYCWLAFCQADELCEELGDLAFEDTLYRFDKDIAPIENTIILG